MNFAYIVFKLSMLALDGVDYARLQNILCCNGQATLICDLYF